MAFNPPLFDASTPMSKVGEFFLCKRGKLSFTLETEGLPKLKASTGSMYLTTNRIVFVPEPAVKLGGEQEFKAFELPLDSMTNEKFNQPIFGANNLTGVVKPIEGMGLTGDAKFKLTFNSGGAGTFLKLFFRALVDARSGGGSFLPGLIQSGTFVGFVQGVMDPNDPSKVYIEQPNFPVAQPDQPSIPVAHPVKSS